MAIIKDSIEIKASPKEVFNGLVKVFSSQEYFKKWHKDHVKCQWLKGKPFEKGSILYVEENLHGRLHKMKFLGTKLELYRRIDYKLLFPMSIICPKGSFTVEPKGKSCIFTATLYFRFGRFLTKFAKSKVEAMENHMRDEGENLKKLIEKSL